MNSTIKKLNRLAEKCSDHDIKLGVALQELSTAASEVLGRKVVADMCQGNEIEFRIVYEDGSADSSSCIRMDDVIAVAEADALNKERRKK